MKPLYRSFALIAAIAVALPTAALAFRAVNSLQVNQVDSNVFEVIGRAGAFKEDYWCGAGDYLRRQLRLPWSTEIYVVSEIGRGVTTGARSAVQFTINPEAVGVVPYEKSWVSNILTVGYSRSVTAAFHYCDRRLFNPLWF
ncbi:hypothetical protein FEE96_06565 [Parasedimentitalea maritima]|uniref:Uncharacterized protein n=1 Tax=Parasedimentitalea maritima TaxID=2578117 RepID=A0A5R8ZMI1_9RHOB|nr:hypothetical protein [Zongyanglinia marina]KAE9627895.1 hypothetical protein GP644_17515 [Zongyanglinia marina]TLP67009.1 hypothetical protein FEE96_06565 [Zongyanglinia marina]